VQLLGRMRGPSVGAALSLPVASAAAMATPLGSQPIYRPRGSNPLHALFRRRFSAFQDTYEQCFASNQGWAPGRDSLSGLLAAA
jgi:hypothetical protein